MLETEVSLDLVTIAINDATLTHDS